MINETIRRELDSLRETHSLLGDQLANLERLVAPPGRPALGPILRGEVS